MCGLPFLLRPCATGAGALDPDSRSLRLPARTCKIVEQIAHSGSKSCTSTKRDERTIGVKRQGSRSIRIRTSGCRSLPVCWLSARSALRKTCTAQAVPGMNPRKATVDQFLSPNLCLELSLLPEGMAGGMLIFG
jgi:hypothetical protein